MNINQIDGAAHQGVPFTLKVADGDSCEAPYAEGNPSSLACPKAVGHPGR